MVLALRHGVAAADPARRRALPARRLVRRRGRAAHRGPSRGRRPDRPRRAGVSSFGISGTNAHVILEEYRPRVAAPASVDGEQATGAAAVEPARRPGLIASDVTIWPVSARSHSALAGQAARLAGTCASTATSPRRRSAGRWPPPGRRSTTAPPWRLGAEELLAGLDALAAGPPGRQPRHRYGHRHRHRTRLRLPRSGRPVGADGRRPGRPDPVFDAKLAECQRALAPYLDVDLVWVLTGDDESWLERVEVVQPVLWAVGIALAAVWREGDADGPPRVLRGPRPAPATTPPPVSTDTRSATGDGARARWHSARLGVEHRIRPAQAGGHPRRLRWPGKTKTGPVPALVTVPVTRLPAGWAGGEGVQPGEQLVGAEARHGGAVVERRAGWWPATSRRPPGEVAVLAHVPRASRAACPARAERDRADTGQRVTSEATRPGRRATAVVSDGLVAVHGRRFGDGGRASSRMTWALVPLMPKEETPARRGRSGRRPGAASVSSATLPRRPVDVRGGLVDVQGPRQDAVRASPSPS